MNQFGSLYSQYYDLLYQDKDYFDEASYIEKLIYKYSRSENNTMLDMGCGTGRHAEIFCDKGWSVHGIDISKQMLEVAEQRSKGREGDLSFSLSNISELSLNKKFDVVFSLFHVINYQNTNEDLVTFFKVAMDHLNDNGVLIFDFWYGPAVLTNRPNVRIKRLDNHEIKVTRIAEPTMFPDRNVVNVSYDIFIESRKDGLIRKHEDHEVRYLFDPELEMVCKNIGFDVVHKEHWMQGDKPDFNSWNVVWVLRKI